MSSEQAPEHDQTELPSAQVIQRVADALGDTEVGEAAAVTQAGSETPLPPRRGS